MRAETGLETKETVCFSFRIYILVAEQTEAKNDPPILVAVLSVCERTLYTFVIPTYDYNLGISMTFFGHAFVVKSDYLVNLNFNHEQSTNKESKCQMMECNFMSPTPL